MYDDPRKPLKLRRKEGADMRLMTFPVCVAIQSIEQFATEMIK
jgi:hypothetical protein